MHSHCLSTGGEGCQDGNVKPPKRPSGCQTASHCRRCNYITCSYMWRLFTHYCCCCCAIYGRLPPVLKDSEAAVNVFFHPNRGSLHLELYTAQVPILDLNNLPWNFSSLHCLFIKCDSWQTISWVKYPQQRWEMWEGVLEEQSIYLEKAIIFWSFFTHIAHLRHLMAKEISNQGCSCQRGLHPPPSWPPTCQFFHLRFIACTQISFKAFHHISLKKFPSTSQMNLIFSLPLPQISIFSQMDVCGSESISTACDGEAGTSKCQICMSRGDIIHFYWKHFLKRVFQQKIQRADADAHFPPVAQVLCKCRGEATTSKCSHIVPCVVLCTFRVYCVVAIKERVSQFVLFFHRSHWA